jgi:hypothetical protein
MGEGTATRERTGPVPDRPKVLVGLQRLKLIVRHTRSFHSEAKAPFKLFFLPQKNSGMHRCIPESLIQSFVLKETYFFFFLAFFAAILFSSPTF